MNEIFSACPAEYRDKLFLDAHDIMDIMGIGEASAYRYLQSPPFKTVRIGKLVRVNAASFWSWYAEN